MAVSAAQLRSPPATVDQDRRISAPWPNWPVLSSSPPAATVLSETWPGWCVVQPEQIILFGSQARATLARM
jgi:hypothetical protein